MGYVTMGQRLPLSGPHLAPFLFTMAVYTHSSQTKESQGQRKLIQHLLCARHLLGPFSPHTRQQVLLSCLQVKLRKVRNK